MASRALRSAPGLRFAFVAPATFRGGVFTSTLSCVLLALLAVGRIILARKPSSGALPPAMLILDLGRSWPFWFCIDNDGRDSFFFTVVEVSVEVVVFVDPPTRDADVWLVSLFKVDGLRVRVAVLLARLGGLAGPVPPSFAAEAAVGAVAAAGR